MRAIDYLLSKEWSMGNDQCPECYGASSKWLGHPLHQATEAIGHEPDCALALAIKEAGGQPMMAGEFHGPVKVPEHVIALCAVLNDGFERNLLQELGL